MNSPGRFRVPRTSSLFPAGATAHAPRPDDGGWRLRAAKAARSAPRWSGIAGLLVALLLPAGAGARPAFVGILGSGHDLRFGLEQANRQSVSWLRVGQAVDGYRVVRYSPADERLTLERDGGVVVLTLPHARLADAARREARFETIARRAVRWRDGWSTDVRTHPPQPHGHDMWVLVTRMVAGRREARMVILSASGVVKDCWHV